VINTPLKIFIYFLVLNIKSFDCRDLIFVLCSHLQNNYPLQHNNNNNKNNNNNNNNNNSRHGLLFIKHTLGKRNIS
jgi:hypothetical protein